MIKYASDGRSASGHKTIMYHQRKVANNFIH